METYGRGHGDGHTGMGTRGHGRHRATGTGPQGQGHGGMGTQGRGYGMGTQGRGHGIWHTETWEQGRHGETGMVAQGWGHRDMGTWGHRDQRMGIESQGQGHRDCGVIVVWHWVTTPVGWCHTMDSHCHPADCHSNSPGTVGGKAKGLHTWTTPHSPPRLAQFPDFTAQSEPRAPAQPGPSQHRTGQAWTEAMSPAAQGQSWEWVGVTPLPSAA